MTTYQWAVAWVGPLAAFACAIGLVMTGRWRMAHSLMVYCWLIFVLGTLHLIEPSLNTWGYWTLRQTAYTAAKLSLAVELVLRVCQPFPGARGAGRKWAALALLGIGAMLLLQPWQSDPIVGLLGEIHARATIGQLWLFVGLILLVRHYRLPVHPFHMGLLTGFAVYLSSLSVMLRLFSVVGWDAYDIGNIVNPHAYVLFSCWLAWIAWRRDGEAEREHDDVIGTLRGRLA